MQLSSDVTVKLTGNLAVLNNPKIVTESGNDYKEFRAFLEGYGYQDLFVKDTASFYDFIDRYTIFSVPAHNGFFVIDTPYVDKDKKSYLIVTDEVNP